MKKFFLILALILIAAGAACMSYSAYWVFDVLAGAAILVGAGLATAYALKAKISKRKRIVLLCALYVAVVLLIIAGSVLFSGTILLAILGAAALTVYGFPLMKM